MRSDGVFQSWHASWDSSDGCARVEATHKPICYASRYGGEGSSYLFAPVTSAKSWLSLPSHGGRPIFVVPWVGKPSVGQETCRLGVLRKRLYSLQKGWYFFGGSRSEVAAPDNSLQSAPCSDNRPPVLKCLVFAPPRYACCTAVSSRLIAIDYP